MFSYPAQDEIHKNYNSNNNIANSLKHLYYLTFWKLLQKKNKSDKDNGIIIFKKFQNIISKILLIKKRIFHHATSSCSNPSSIHRSNTIFKSFRSYLMFPIKLTFFFFKSNVIRFLKKNCRLTLKTSILKMG